MDLLFKRYASPYLLINQMILGGMFSDFVKNVVDFDHAEKIWQFYLHKIFSQTFEEFKGTLNGNLKTQISEFDIETTVNDSFELLQNFVPDNS